MRLRKEEQRYALKLITPSMIVVFGVIIVPIITTLIYTLVNIDPLSSHKGEFAGLSFYAKAITSREFWEDLRRTLHFTIASTALETIIGLFVALLPEVSGRPVPALHHHHSLGDPDGCQRQPVETDAERRIRCHQRCPRTSSYHFRLSVMAGQSKDCHVVHHPGGYLEDDSAGCHFLPGRPAGDRAFHL